VNLSVYSHASISAEHKCAWRKVRQILDFISSAIRCMPSENSALPFIRARCAQMMIGAQRPSFLS
jgi:hypothetical protein